MAETKFQKLTPIDEVDLSEYEDAFQYVFENEDVRNIAVFGPYGSGKSSVLQTYEKNHDSDKKLMHISLAHFSTIEASEKQKNILAEENITQSDKTESSEIIVQEFIQNGNNRSEEAQQNDQEENILEEKIINHLINQIPKDDIPDTRFHIKEDVKKRNYILIAIGITVIVVAILYFTHLEWWSNWVNTINGMRWKSFFHMTISHKFQAIFGVLALGILFYGIFRVIMQQAKGRFIKRLSFQGNEIELCAEAEDSFFEKYSTEILYLFRQVKADAIVFEDFDRFNNVKIFERLREINTLVNYQRESSLKFIYVLRDDIFTTKDRVKFFDYIIPIIPVINGSNSYSLLASYLKDLGMLGKFTERFLRELSLYIEDVRLIKNIVNEFIIFEKKLNSINLDYDKLLAVVTYKNLFPRDYVRLQQSKGYVYCVFNELDDSHVRELSANSKMTLVEKTNRDPNSEWLMDKAENKIGEEVFREISNNDYFKLLRLLLANGYIDECYNDYLTFFYPDKLSLKDKIFIHSVKDKRAESYNFQINNVEEVLKYFGPDEFLQKEILNYDLVKYLLTADKDKDYLESLIAQLSEDEEFDFIRSLYETGLSDQEIDSFVIQINEFWPEFFSAICCNQDKSLDELKRRFSIITLLKCDESTLERVNMDNNLANYISNQSDYLDPKIVQNHTQTFLKALQFIRVKFLKIDENADPTLLNGVYSLSLYDMNSNNLNLFLKLKYNIPYFEKGASEYITIIRSKEEEPLCEYFFKEPEKTVKAILDLTNGGPYNDDQNDLIWLLNIEEIPSKLRVDYLTGSITEITFLRDVEDTSFYNILIEERRVVRTAENILQYYSIKNELTDVLVNFINDAEEKIDYTSAGFDISLKTRFFQESMKSEKLNLERFRDIALHSGITYNKSPIQSGLPMDKVEVLSEECLITMTVSNLQKIRNEYPTALKSYICSNVKQYLSIIGNNNNYIVNEVAQALLWNEISVEDRILLFMNKKSRELFQVELYQDFDLLQNLLDTQGINDKEKLDLVRNNILGLNKDQKERVLISVGGEEIVNAMRSKARKNVSISPENDAILKMLMDVNIIESYDIVEDKYGNKSYHFTLKHK